MRLTVTHRPAAALAIAALLVVFLPPGAGAQPRRAGSAAAPDDPLSHRGWHLELTGHGALEAWNYNISHEETLGLFSGITYGIRDGLVLKVASALYHVWQRGTDAYLFGLTWGVRGRLTRKARWSGFWEFDVGVSEADTPTPPNGTRFNYLAIGGGGVTVRLRPGIYALGGLRWVHVSNNGLAGRDRNPDLEAVGPTIGVMFGF